MQTAIEHYTNSRNKELIKIVNDFNEATQFGIIRIMKTNTYDSESDHESAKKETLPQPEKGNIEKQAEKMFEKINPSTNNDEDKKRKRKDTIGKCVFIGRDGNQCCKNGTNHGECGKWKGKILCSLHFNSSRRRCHMKGCNKFAHLCKDHDQNKPANEKFDDQMEIAQTKKKQKDQLQDETLEEEKQAKLQQLEEEKQTEPEELKSILTEEPIGEKPDDYDYNEESEMSDYESDSDSGNENDNEFPKACNF